MIELFIAVRPVMVVIMFVLFAAIILWAYAPRRRAHLDACGHIPLRDDPALRDKL